MKEPRRENRMIGTIVSRATEGVEINPIRSNMWDIYSQKGPTHGQKIIQVRTTLPVSWAETARRPSLLIARASFGGGGFSLSQ